MKNLVSTPFATHPYPEQVIDAFDGFAVEVCLRDDSLNTAFHIRYRAYLAAELAPANKEQLFYNESDFLPNSRIHLVWYEGKPVATIRGSIYSDEYDWMPTESFTHFPQLLRDKLPPPTRILESNRFAVDPDFQGRQSLFAQFLLFRAHGLNAGAHCCTHIMTGVRKKHCAFYQRFLGMDPLSEEGIYIEWFRSEVLLLVNETESCLEKILRRGMPNYNFTDIQDYATRAQLQTTLLRAVA